MKVLSFDTLRDGGTLSIQTDEGLFTVDNRIVTTTAGKVFNGHPKNDKSNLVEDEQVLLDLTEAIKESSSLNFSRFMFALTNR